MNDIASMNSVSENVKGTHKAADIASMTENVQMYYDNATNSLERKVSR